jgi:hypothetical protein
MGVYMKLVMIMNNVRHETSMIFRGRGNSEREEA